VRCGAVRCVDADARVAMGRVVCAEIYRLISRKAVSAVEGGAASGASVGTGASIVLTPDNANDGKDGDGKAGGSKLKCCN
jgi:hypothetical protein